MKSSAVGFKVVLPLAMGGESEKYPQKFRKLGAEFVGQPCASDEEFIAFARDADAVITVGSIRPVPRKVIENLERCRLISNTQIGYDSIDTMAATEQGILVTNVPDYCVEEVSDHAMALILACSRKIVQLNEAAKKGQWGLSDDPNVKETIDFSDEVFKARRSLKAAAESPTEAAKFVPAPRA